MTQTIDETLAERGERYGDFVDHAYVTQELKRTLACGESWLDMDDDMKECLEMVMHKVGRIVNGDPDYVDSWTDIIGYTRLVEKRLITEQTAQPETEKVGTILDATKAYKADLEKRRAAEPDSKELSDALNLLLAAGVITQVDGDS